jgi:hypothetical protein
MCLLTYVQMNAFEVLLALLRCGLWCVAVGRRRTNIVSDVLCVSSVLLGTLMLTATHCYQKLRSRCDNTSSCYCKTTIRMVWWQFCLFSPCCRSRQPEAQWGGGTCTLGEEDPSWQGKECASDQKVRCSSLCCDSWRNGSSEALHPYSVTPHERREPVCPSAATTGTQSSVGAL